MPNSKRCLWHVTSQNCIGRIFTSQSTFELGILVISKLNGQKIDSSIPSVEFIINRFLLPSVEETVDRKKSGYFSVMKCFGFIILTRSVNTNLCNLKFWPVFTNLSTCYISFASLYFLHLQNDASLKVKTVVHEDCDRWLFFHEKKKMNSFFAPSIVERRNFFSTKWCDRFCQP